MSAHDNAIRPRQFAIHMIARQRAEVRRHIDDLIAHTDQTHHYHSATRVYLERVVELLGEAIDHLHANRDTDDDGHL